MPEIEFVSKIPAAVLVKCDDEPMKGAAESVTVTEVKDPMIIVEWICRVFKHEETTLPTCLLFTHAIMATGVRVMLGYRLKDESGAVLWLWAAVGFAAAACFTAAQPACKQIVDEMFSKSAIKKTNDRMYASAAVGIVSLTLGTMCRHPVYAGVLIAAGILINCELFQMYRRYLFNMAAGGKMKVPALDAPHANLLVFKNLAHHLATFVAVPNADTACFVGAWRFCSILPHSLAYLQAEWHVPKSAVSFIGWGRFYICVGFFQPVAILAIASRFGLGAAALLGWTPFGYGQTLGAWLDARWLVPLGDGLCANATGHASYFVFRILTLEKMRRQRAAGTLTGWALNPVFGRGPGHLEKELGLLCLLTCVILTAPAPSYIRV